VSSKQELPSYQSEVGELNWEGFGGNGEFGTGSSPSLSFHPEEVV